MSGAEMEALIQRVEKAEGPDRELDGEIHGIPSAACCDWDDVPHYTASLDAAVSLVPSGWDWSISKGWNEAAIASLAPAEKAAEVTTEAATAALALLAAILKALLAMEGGDHG
jgi:hypothetical protein